LKSFGSRPRAPRATHTTENSAATVCATVSMPERLRMLTVVSSGTVMGGGAYDTGGGGAWPP